MSYRVAVLVSGSGSNLQALIDAERGGTLPAQVALVVSDRADAYGLQRALQAEIPTAFIPLPRAAAAERAAVRAAWEQRLLALINAYTPDLVVLAGFMRILSADFLAGCTAPVINQHPALLPPDHGNTVITSNGRRIPALRGAHVVADALRLGLPVTGCTVHRVTPQVDAGPLLATTEVPILPTDHEASLHERIKAEERRLLVAVVGDLATQHGS